MGRAFRVFPKKAEFAIRLGLRRLKMCTSDVRSLGPARSALGHLLRGDTRQGRGKGAHPSRAQSDSRRQSPLRHCRRRNEGLSGWYKDDADVHLLTKD